MIVFVKEIHSKCSFKVQYTRLSLCEFILLWINGAGSIETVFLIVSLLLFAGRYNRKLSSI